MRVRWTTDEADDLERICDDIAESRPDPHSRTHIRSFPFLAVYEVRDDVQVLRILHGAQRWPPP